MAEQGSAGDYLETQGNRWATALAAMSVGAGFFALWFWLLPGWLGFRVEAASGAGWMAGGHSVSAGICRGVALRLGFWMDGTRYSRSHGAAAAIGGGRRLPLCEESHVPGICAGLDWAVGGLRTRQLGCHRRRSGRRARSAFVRGLL